MGVKSVRILSVVILAMPLLCISTSAAQSVATDTRAVTPKPRLVTIDVVNAPITDVLETIARQAGLRPSWDDRVFGLTMRVTLRARDMAADEAFAKVLAGTGLRAEVTVPRVSFVRDGTTESIVQGGISGKVVDAKTKQPLRGATVTVDASSKGVMTGDDGTFRLANIAPGTYTLRVRLLGYIKATRSVAVVEGQMVSVDVALEQSVNALDQIIVTGTIAATAQREIPNAMTVITAKDIEQRGITHVDQLFRGDVPGLFVMNRGSGSLVDDVSMFTRGATSLPSGSSTLPANPIKTYVDGVELANPTYLSQIDPKSIERIEIIAGPQASTVYGSNALNGVMQIFTKRGANTTRRPELTASLMSGVVQNNFSSSLTPQHDYAAQVRGTEQRWSYNAGGTWNYVGPWTPAKQTARTSGFGGARFVMGPVNADATLRLSTTRNRQRGNAIQAQTAGQETGMRAPWYRAGLSAPETSTLNGQTLGLTIGYAPTPWWSHEVTVGTDVSDLERHATAPAITMPSDTMLSLWQSRQARTSLRYSTTVRVPLTETVRAVLTAGADQWNKLSSTFFIAPVALTGTLTGSPPMITRFPDHNAGAFLQGQLSAYDALFVTYGLRAEWNPNYGENSVPNLAPRYGLAYTHDLETPLGVMTAKLRASYGRSTRPPAAGQKASSPQTDATYISYYGRYTLTIAAPDLEPERQQGGEGGLELYFGTRGSLVVTRYNQTVDNLVVPVVVDSTRSLATMPSGFPYYRSRDVDGYGWTGIYQSVNIASIRNQGWEVQGSLNTGPVTTKGTYSWTKSRAIGLNPKYKLDAGYYTTQYQPGASFDFLPEHTWAINITYARAATTLALNVNGTGYMYRSYDNLYYDISFPRLDASKPRKVVPTVYRSTGPAYRMADFQATQRVSAWLDGVLSVWNLTDFYRNDVETGYASIGRQAQMGVRIRW